MIEAGVATGMLSLLWVGGIIGGVGFGASFSGAVRTIAPLVQPHQRAGLFASIYLVAYLSFGVPAIIAGLLIAPIGLQSTVLGYGVAILVAASRRLASGSGARLTRTRTRLAHQAGRWTRAARSRCTCRTLLKPAAVLGGVSRSTDSGHHGAGVCDFADEGSAAQQPQGDRSRRLIGCPSGPWDPTRDRWRS